MFTITGQGAKFESEFDELAFMALTLIAWEEDSLWSE